MVSHHMNPYLYGPFELGNNSYTAPVDPLWGNAPAPYGPLFLQIDGFFARITFHNELATIVLLRLLALVGVLLIARVRAQAGPALPPGRRRAVHADGAQPGDHPPPDRRRPQRRPDARPARGRADGGQGEATRSSGSCCAPWPPPSRPRPPSASSTSAGAGSGPRRPDPGPDTAGGDRRPDRGRASSGSSPTSAASGGAGSPSSAPRAWSGRGRRRPPRIALLVTGVAHVAHIGVGLGGVLTVTRFLGLLAAAVAGVWLLLNSDRIGTLKALGRDPAALRAPRSGGPALVPVVGPDPAGPGGPRPAPLADHRAVDGDRLHRAARRDPAGHQPASTATRC